MPQETAKVKSVEKVKTLNERLAEIQKELKAPKNQINEFAHFNYRNCEDILEALKPLLGDLILTLRDEIVQVGDRYYVKSTACISMDTNHFLEVSAYAREAEVKTGMDSAQITGATSSYARKYALNGLFLIDDTQDPDSKDNTPKPTTEPIKTTSVSKQTVVKPVEKVVNPVVNSTIPATTETKGQLPIGKDPARDTSGRTYCPGIDKDKPCGKTVSKRVEEYSVKTYHRILCMSCQLKLKGERNAQEVRE